MSSALPSASFLRAFFRNEGEKRHRDGLSIPLRRPSIRAGFNGQAIGY